MHRYLDAKTAGDNGDTGTGRPLVPDCVRMGSRRRFPAGDTAGDKSQSSGDRTRGRAGNTGSGPGSVVTSGCPTGPGCPFSPEIPCRGMVRRACSCASVPTPRSTGNGCRSCRRGLPGQHEPGRVRLGAGAYAETRRPGHRAAAGPSDSGAGRKFALSYRNLSEQVTDLRPPITDITSDNLHLSLVKNGAILGRFLRCEQAPAVTRKGCPE